ncbi:MAG TPA: neutral zinc metallopeptidase [Steroidobacteraceae bacterium]|nr:neutral zinc metallopeptidase [Steroidobacteraceae bacterium]
MEWRGRRESGNVEDRRGRRVPGGVAGISGAGIVIVLVVSLLTGQNPLSLLQSMGAGTESQGAASDQPYQETPEEHELSQFVRVVLADTEDIWGKIFQDGLGRPYEKPTLVLFTDAVQSGCGSAQAQMGPFYCPADHKLYIDLGFYQELRERFGAPGDFAQAYVIAHEVGHHVQNLLGLSDKAHAAEQRAGEAGANAISVKVELQADCYAGVWAHHTEQQKHVLEQGDLEEAIGAAQAVGDDRLQMQGQGRVVPETFTHGSAEQRAHWFEAGFSSGDMNRCDTFK